MTNQKPKEIFLPVSQAVQVMFQSLDWDSANLTEVSRIYIRNKTGNEYRIIRQDHCVSFQKRQPHQKFFHDIGVIPEGKYRIFLPTTHVAFEDGYISALRNRLKEIEDACTKMGEMVNGVQ